MQLSTVIVRVLVGCAVMLTACSSDPTPTVPASTSANEPGGSDAGDAKASSNCTKPETGVYMATLELKSSCPWWDDTDTKLTIRILDESVQYPHSDDLCGGITMAANGCEVKDECGPLKISAGSQGWIGKGIMSVVFTDNTHFTGTITYDINHACKTELAIVAAERLKLGGG